MATGVGQVGIYETLPGTMLPHHHNASDDGDFLYYDVRVFGALADGVADDTIPVQDAVDFCLDDPLRPKVLVITGPCRLTAPIIIDRLVDVSIIKGAFRIIGLGKRAGFYVDTPIDIFSSSFIDPAVPVSEAISFENLQFEASNAALAAYVLDGEKFTRIQFLNCRFCYIKSLTSTVHIQSLYFTKCMLREWTGTFINSTSAFDVSFEGNFIEWAEGGLWVATNTVYGGRFINNLMEGCAGRVLDFFSIQGMAIVGNFLEANLCASPYMKLGTAGGVALAGNSFFLTNAQVLDPDFYAVEWTGPNLWGSSVGNYCSGRLNKLTNGVTFGSFIDVGNFCLNGPVMQVLPLPNYANNAAAVAGGVPVGGFYRTNVDPDVVCVVH